MKKDLRAILQDLQQQGLYRQRKEFSDPATARRTLKGKSIVSFCSNDYLGLANDPRIIEALREGASTYGVGSGASHLISGYSTAHRVLEETIADFVNRPRALFFTSGYMANLGVISALLDRTSTLFEDRLNHASLIDGGILSRAKLFRYPHKDLSFLHSKLNPSEHSMVVSDTVFSMDGDIAPLTDLARLCQDKQALLMVDDAHGIGVFGDQGAGVCAMHGLDTNQVPVLVGTFGKATGVFGAFVAGEEDLIETLIQKARSYIYTTAPPPALAHATTTAIHIVRKEQWRREKLFKRVTQFKDWASQADIQHSDSPSPIQAIFTTSTAAAMELSQQLLEQGIYVSAIRPPTVPQGTARLRITLSSAHTQQDIEHLIDCLSTSPLTKGPVISD